MPRRFLPTIAILVTMLLMGALSVAPVAAQSDSATVVYRLAVSGDEEVCAPADPPRCGGEGTGEAIVIVNPSTDTVCFLARWRDVEGMVVAAHIHEAPDGVQGGVVVPLLGGVQLEGEDKARGCVSGQGLTDEINETPSDYYINFHSTVFPDGALRAQLG